MKKYLLLVIFITLFIGFGRWLIWSNSYFPHGRGMTTPSPGYLYYASVTRLYTESFLGAKRTRLRFEVKNAKGEIVHQWEIPIEKDFDFDPITDRAIITWAANASHVSFVFSDAEVVFRIDQ